MSVLNNSLLLGAPTGGGGGGGAYQIARSLRFASNDSAYLERTPASAGNSKTWTWSGWIKLTAPETTNHIFTVPTGTSDANYFRLWIDSAGKIRVGNYNANLRISTQTLLDPTAWYHIVLAFDTTQATAANRIKLYVNGSQLTSFATASDPALNYDSAVNTANTHRIGSEAAADLNGYLAEVYLIDGQALTPSSFGQADGTTGEWVAKAYSGSYGTNGFYLNFSDNSNTTAATLGKDSSGNSRNWTPYNFSISAGAGNDSLVDSPASYGTDTGAGGEVRGNYATLNPLDRNRFASTETLSQGNLEVAFIGTGDFGARSSFYVSSGKWYWEGTLKTAGTGLISFGVSQQSSQYYTGYSPGSYAYLKSGNKMEDATQVAYGASYAANDVIGIALNLDAGTITFYKNGTSQGQAFTGVTGVFTPSVGCSSSSSTAWILNFGQRPFAYAAPSGFKALCDTNLPTPTISKPSSVLDTVLYTGTGSTQTPTSTLGFSPDLVWIKSRSAATDHALYDTVRGAQARIEASTSSAEATSDNGVTAFNSAGFTLGSRTQVNSNTDTYAAWCWDAGSSNATNNNGTISSTVRANASAGFSIVTYTGNGTAGATIGHGLGVAPTWVIVKARSAANSWNAYTTALDGSLDFFVLNSTAAKSDSAQSAPTSSVFSVSNGTNVNGNGTTYVAYCWAPVAGLSQSFTWTGNGSAVGPFVYLGFRPAFLLLKQATAASTTDWVLLDCRRAGYNIDNDPLYPNLASVEATTDLLDFTANGFKIRSTNGLINANNGTYVGLAFAEFPFQYARAR
jgi:hypothetical protein